MSAALVGGMVVGLIGFVGSTVTVLVLSRSVLNPLAQTPGSGGPSLVTVAAELGLALVALVAIGVALVGGAAMIPVRWALSSRPTARPDYKNGASNSGPSRSSFSSGITPCNDVGCAAAIHRIDWRAL
jgi:hypothetical protein